MGRVSHTKTSHGRSTVRYTVRRHVNSRESRRVYDLTGAIGMESGDSLLFVKSWLDGGGVAVVDSLSVVVRVGSYEAEPSWVGPRFRVMEIDNKSRVMHVANVSSLSVQGVQDNILQLYICLW